MNELKLIFLDLDGVLLTFKGSANGGLMDQFDPQSLAVLERFLTEFPETQIVVSSTWRKSGHLMEKALKQSQLIFLERFFGYTPSHPYGHRGHEIKEFLDDIEAIGEYDKVTYVAIDDDYTQIQELHPGRVVRTTMARGLEGHHYRLLKRLLYGDLMEWKGTDS